MINWTSLKTLWMGALLALAALLWPGAAQAGLQWVQIGKLSGDNVCGDLETGIGDDRRLRFLPYSRFVRGSSIEERIQVQRGSTIAVRLLGHGADILPSVREEVNGLTASARARGRYVNQPGSSGPIGFVEVRIEVRANATLGNNSVYVNWPTGEARIPLRLVSSCSQTREAPKLAIADSKCFGAGGTNCGVPIGPINPLAVCSKGLCLYSGGSITHDECCAANASGHACGGPATFVSGESVCRTDMDRAVLRAATGFSWHRETDFNKVNKTGKVVARDVCAPRGAIVHREDERFCCARMGVRVEPTLAERNKSELNPMVKGYVTAGPARSTVPPGAVACD